MNIIVCQSVGWIFYNCLIFISYENENSPTLLQAVGLVGVSVTVQRHYDHWKSFKGKHLIGACLQFQFYTFVIMMEDIAGCNHPWCWRMSWESYIWISRQHQDTATLGLALENSNPAPIIAFPCFKRTNPQLQELDLDLWGSFLLKPPHSTFWTP